MGSRGYTETVKTTNLDRRRVLAISAAVAALGLCAYVVFRPDPSYPTLPTQVNFVCVKTGERFVLDRRAPECRIIPAQNPRTHERTLLPCSEVDGKWVVNDHYRGAVVNFAGENHYVDPQTLEVRSAP